MSLKAYFKNRSKPVSQKELKTEKRESEPTAVPAPISIPPENMCYGCWLNCGYGPSGMWFF